MESNLSGNNREPLLAHLSMFAACAIWGLMAPLGKDAMTHGLDGPSMVMLRVSGGALLFWIASLFTKREHVPLRHVLTFAGAAVFGDRLKEPVHAHDLRRDVDDGLVELLVDRNVLLLVGGICHGWRRN